MFAAGKLTICGKKEAQGLEENPGSVLAGQILKAVVAYSSVGLLTLKEGILSWGWGERDMEGAV